MKSETVSREPKYFWPPSRVVTLTTPDMTRPYSGAKPPVRTTTSSMALLLMIVLELPDTGSCWEKPSTK
jgi:hypothetical protein